MTKIFLICCGTVSVALGIIGIFVPVLPTTPFLLLASACYARSSQRFHHWLLTNRWCGSYIRNYRDGLGIPVRQKILTILLLWGMIGWSAVYAVDALWIRILLVVIAAAVTVHLIMIRTRHSEKHFKEASRSDTR